MNHIGNELTKKGAQAIYMPNAKGVSTRSYTSSKISFDLKHASIILNPTTLPQGSPISRPVHCAKGKDELGKLRKTLVLSLGNAKSG